MKYEIRYTPEANIGLAKLEKYEPKAFAKALCFLEELREHPKTGTGHPEPLKGKPEGRWSRQITKKHRLVYRIFDEEVVVLVLTAYGHYDDKYN
ncbi:MAG: Txe/YoeB family addiction module toxin [Bacteroidaceae bacterium]|nr:Txe/YoeB family addiction module toxin [Bacteroidaceae bacterium]